MARSTIYLTIVIVMIFFNVILLYKLNQNKKTAGLFPSPDPYATKLLRFDQELLLKNMKVQLNSEGQKVNPKMKVKGNDSMEKSFSDLLNSGPKLVFRFSELNCNTCVDSQFYMLKKYQRLVGVGNIIILTSFNSERSTIFFNDNSELQCPIYNIDFNELGLAIEDLNIPYYFIIDKDMTAKLIHVPAKEFPLLTDEYFSILIKRFYTNTI